MDRIGGGGGGGGEIVLELYKLHFKQKSIMTFHLTIHSHTTLKLNLFEN